MLTVWELPRDPYGWTVLQGTRWLPGFALSTGTSTDHLYGVVVRLPGYTPQRSRVRFPALSDFLSSIGSGTGSTQPL
jgi:hypothetical protein